MPPYEQRPANPLLLLPPNQWDVFKHAATVPFNRAVGKQNRADAYWFAEASLLAYARPDEDFARQAYAQAFVRAGCHDVEVTAGAGPHGANWYVITARECRLLVFRGSEVFGNKWDEAQFKQVFEDWFVTDARLGLHRWTANARAHKGFIEAYDGVAAAIMDALQRQPQAPLFITGHSLGAGMAMLAASHLWASHIASTVYTFAAPRVGDAGFAQTCLGLPIFRYIVSLDMVAQLPPRGVPLFDGYVHCPPQARTYDESLIAAHDGPADQPFPLYLKDIVLAGILSPIKVIEGIGHLDLSGQALATFRPIVDHAPLLYAIAAYNDWLNDPAA